MIVELRIENFAIIQRLDLEFGEGLLTFTGETGAGKSIILDALEAVMGGRTDGSLIRAGSERAYIEATFAVPASARDEIRAALAREDLLEEGEELRFITLSRELRANGRSAGRVNGRSVGVTLLREIGGLLVDIHGQSEHLSLLNVRQHLRLLDQFAATAPLLEPYRATYRQLRGMQRELFELRRAERDAARRTDLLTFQVDEIDAAALTPGEEDELRQERTRLANAESLAASANQALALLDEGDPETAPVSELFGQVVEALSSLARVDTGQSELLDNASQAADLIDELVRDLRAYLEEIEFNPRRLEQVEDRIDLINGLKRKYGGTIEAVLAHAESARKELDTIAHATERIEELQAQQEALLRKLSEQGLALSAARKQAGERLGSAVERELDDLRMAGARFAVDFRSEPDPEGVPLPDGQTVGFDENGLDKIEFLIAPNPGEGLKPLVKIASGGETSRLMLALKKVLASADDIPTLVFDEIDQGIGGRVGTVVGEKLWQLARSHQVLCITHLPQLAAFGEHHFRVRKLVNEGRTSTAVEELSGDERLDEMAQMLGSVTDANRAAARETLALAQRRAQQFLSAPPIDPELPF
jgi:DNA repair protein RecN (Recombination protein N)